MIAEQLPSLEEIYDYSTEELKRIADTLNQRIANTPNHAQVDSKLQEFIENINIELEQRKTLEFFQELCSIDNPYLKKVTDFNNQFLKLAEQAIAQQQEQQNGENLQEKQKNKRPTTEEHDTHDTLSVTSAASSNAALTENNQSVTHQTCKSTDKMYGGFEKKMGIGHSKTNAKNSMKDFILSTLSKNKADGCVVVKKGGPPKPQPTFTVNERGHLVSANTLQPISTKSIKSNSIKKPPAVPLSSTKQISEAPSKINERELQKKRQEVAEKLKGKKPQKLKEKHLNNKELVEMIRQQQHQKQVKKQRQEQNYEIKVEEKREEKKQQKKQNLQPTNCPQSSKSQQRVADSHDVNEEIVEQIQSEELSIGEKNYGALAEKHKRFQSQEQIKEQIHVQQKIQKPQIKLSNTVNKQKEIKGQAQSQCHQIEQKISVPTVTTPLELHPEPQLLCQASKTINQEQKQIRSEVVNPNYQCQRQELQQIKRQAQLFDKKIQSMQIPSKEQSFGVIIDVVSDYPKASQLSQKDATKESEVKKCYNQQYWIHIREEAEYQIKRFKQEKEIEEISKQKIIQQISRSTAEDTKQLEIQPEEISKNTNQPQSKEEEDQTDKYYEQKKKQLKRMIDYQKKKLAPKRASAPVVAPPKPLYVLPTFNYLEVYPTFNHIFSVMYTKAEHQAIQDIPSIMRELTNIFTTHINHFKSKNNYFQAGIFLPFDSSSKFQMTDPKQLLSHTEGTYVNLKKMVERLQIFNSNLHGQFSDGQQRYYRVVKTKEEVYDIITTGFLRRKFWKELPHGCSLRSSWNLFWSWSKPDIDISKLLVWQRINHFPFNKNLSRKDLLYKNLDSFRKLLKISFNFLPLTFNLPKEYTQFSIKFHEEEMLNRDRNYWIMKPIGKSRGRGIKVISNLAELNYTDNIVVQKYITNPLLLDGYKFDMRIYVLVTSFHPLQAFVYRQGFARLSTEKFSLEPMMMKNAFIHLTNFSINRNNEEAKETAAFSGGSKISLKALKDRLTKMNYSFNKIWSQVHEIIIKSLLGCSISVPPFPAAFQLFGYDIMIDTDGSCHLIEINASPSLERSYLIDEIIKQSLIDDILDIVDPPQFDKQQLLDIISQRLMGKGKITPQEDLIAIARCLKYKKLRKFGQVPENMGLFERVAPCQMSSELQRLVKSRSGANNPRNID